jgi:hypothetical protein
MNPFTFYHQNVLIAAGSSDCGTSTAKTDSVTEVPIEQSGFRRSDLASSQDRSAARALVPEDCRGHSKASGHRELSHQLGQLGPSRSPSGVFQRAAATGQLPRTGARL